MGHSRTFTVLTRCEFMRLRPLCRSERTTARPSLLMFRIDRPIARISSSLVLYRVPRSGSVTSAERIVITWTHIRWVRWMFQNLALPAAQKVRDCSSSVTLCIVMKNDGFLYHKVSSFTPQSMELQSLRQSERSTAKDPVQHERWTYPCYRAVSIITIIRVFCPKAGPLLQAQKPKLQFYRRLFFHRKLRNQGWSFTRDLIGAVASRCFPHPLSI